MIGYLDECSVDAITSLEKHLPSTHNEVKKNYWGNRLKATYGLNFRKLLKYRLVKLNYWRNKKSTLLFGRLLKIITMRAEPGSLLAFVVDQ